MVHFFVSPPAGGPELYSNTNVLGLDLKELGFLRDRFFIPKMRMKKSDTAVSMNRVRIKIKAYDHKVIDQTARKIVETAERTGASVTGPVPLPTETHRVTVNRSSFVHKNSRDQYEMRVHKRVIDIVNPTAKTVDQLTNLDLPAGVDIEIKM